MRRALALAALATLAAGCLPELPEGKNPWLVTPPAPPTDIRKIPDTFALSMISGRQADSVRMAAVDTGRISTHGETVSSLKSYHTELKLNAPAFIIHHSSEGIVLFGTGVSTDPARRPESLLQFLEEKPFVYWQKRHRDLVSKLTELGIRRSDVKWVILSSLEPDQAGMADAFPDATVVVTRQEWEWRKARRKPGEPPGALDPEAFEGRVKLKLVDLSDKPAFGPFENGMDLFGDGSLFLVSLPGRTPGTMGLWVNLDDGPVLLTGSATYVLDNYLDLALPVKGRFDDLDEYWRSLNMIKAAMKGVPRLTVVPGNDLAPLRLSGRSDIPVYLHK